MKRNIQNLNRFFYPIHKDGYVYIAVMGVVALILNAISGFLGFIGFALFFYSVYFFRDPFRHVPQNKNFVLAAADGTVVDICRALPPVELDLGLDRYFTKVSTYLSALDMHINRLPVSGMIERIEYNKGKFQSAAKDKSSSENERNSILIKTEEGFIIPVVQIAGRLTRKIVCWTKEGMAYEAGERFGMIRFGCRVDIYLPDGITTRVAVGQRVIAGETVIADLHHNEESLIVKEI